MNRRATAGKHVAWQAVEEGAILVDLRSGRGLGLNATAARVWQLLGHGPEQAIASRVADEYQQDRTRVLEDVRAFFDTLARRGLVELADA